MYHQGPVESSWLAGMWATITRMHTVRPYRCVVDHGDDVRLGIMIDGTVSIVVVTEDKREMQSHTQEITLSRPHPCNKERVQVPLESAFRRKAGKGPETVRTKETPALASTQGIISVLPDSRRDMCYVVSRCGPSKDFERSASNTPE